MWSIADEQLSPANCLIIQFDLQPSNQHLVAEMSSLGLAFCVLFMYNLN